jgi:hypothetical protein
MVSTSSNLTFVKFAIISTSTVVNELHYYTSNIPTSTVLPNYMNERLLHSYCVFGILLF